MQVSGPAAGLTVIVYEINIRFGWATMCVITALAGVVQIVLSFSGLAHYGLALSPAVVHGMLAGIGLVIGLAQLHVVFGGVPSAKAWDNLSDLPKQLSNLDGPSTLIGLLTIAILLLWPLLLRFKFSKAFATRVPGSLLAIIFVSLLARILNLQVKKVSLPGDFLAGHVLPNWSEVRWLDASWGVGSGLSLILPVLTIALVASIESLLSALAIDKMHQGEKANLDRELLGQGLGNGISGLVGGLPVTGVIIRSSANITAGAKSRLSTILHGLWVIFLCLLGASLISQIPLSALGGLLVYVGFSLIKLHDIKELIKHRELLIYLITLLGVTFGNLLEGVAIGLGLSILLLLRRLSSTDFKIQKQQKGVLVTLNGFLSFLSVPIFIKKMTSVDSRSSVSIVVTPFFIDHAFKEALHSWCEAHKKRGGKVTLNLT
jgi:carbonic anhydrase